MRRYRSEEEDSERWARFAFRPGDLVVSTRSKSGTTWMQQVLLSLVHGPQLSGSLAELSPWVDWLTISEPELWSRLEAQDHRRVVKTHTPLDGLPLDPRATWVVVVRDPLDLAVSLHRQGDNLDRRRIAELTGRTYVEPPPRPPLADWVRAWTLRESDPVTAMDSLQGVVHHAADAVRRRDEDHVVVVGYAELVDDLEGRVRRLAGRLGFAVAEPDWPALVEAASLAGMRAAAARRTPDDRGVLKDPAAFFPRGRPGAGREVLDASDVAAYEVRVRGLVAGEAPGHEAEVLALLGVAA